MSVLDGRLADSEFLAGAEFSIADVAAWPWVRSGAGDPSVDDYPAVGRWMQIVAARPAVQRGIRWMRND